MPRPVLAVAILAVASSLVFFAACNADLTEGCLGGQCTGSVEPDAGCVTASCMAVPKTGDFPCDVFAIIHANCHPCHQDPPKNGAPFPLLTYADTQKPYGPTNLISQQMFDQIQPCGSPRMPLDGMLTTDDFNTLSDWLGGCAHPVAAGQGCGCPGPGCTP